MELKLICKMLPRVDFEHGTPGLSDPSHDEYYYKLNK